MLVLTRRLGEELVIDGESRVTVLAIKGKTVRLGIAAPASVCVLRGELVTRKNGSPAEVVSAEHGATVEVHS